MVKGKKYRFKHEVELSSEPMIYIGYNWSGNEYWHQFTKNGNIWSELANSSLDLIEPVQ